LEACFNNILDLFMFGYRKNGGITSIVVTVVFLILKERVREGQRVWGFSDTDS